MALSNIIEISKTKCSDQTPCCDSQVYSQEMLERTRHSLVILDLDANILAANSAYCGMLETSLNSIIGMSIYDVHHGNWDVAELKALIDKVNIGPSTYSVVVATHDYVAFGVKSILFYVRLIKRNSAVFLLIAMEDVTPTDEI